MKILIKLMILIMLYSVTHLSLYPGTMDLDISRVKYIIESGGDYTKAIAILYDLLNRAPDTEAQSEVYYYLLKCYIIKNNKQKAAEILNYLIQYDTTWSTRGKSEYDQFIKKKRDDRFALNLSDEEIGRIIHNGGTLKEFTKLKSVGITFEHYLIILEKKLNIPEIVDYLNKYDITMEDIIKLHEKQIPIDDFIYLTGSINNNIMSKNRFFSYVDDDPQNITYLIELNKLGYDEVKFIVLKQNNINVAYFIKALKSGFTEKDFHKFKDNRITDADIDFFTYFKDKGYKKRDFYLAKMLGRNNFPKFEAFITNRKKIVATLSFTLSLSFISIALIGTGIGLNAYENELWYEASRLKIAYADKTDYDEKYALIQDIERIKKDLNILYPSEIAVFSIAAAIGVLAIIPAVFLGIYSYQRYKIFNIFSKINFSITDDTLCLYLKHTL